MKEKTKPKKGLRIRTMEEWPIKEYERTNKSKEEYFIIHHEASQPSHKNICRFCRFDDFDSASKMVKMIESSEESSLDYFIKGKVIRGD